MTTEDQVQRLIFRGDGSFSIDPKGDWVSARHYDEALEKIKHLTAINRLRFSDEQTKEIQRLERERDEWSGVAAQRLRETQLVRQELAEVRAELDAVNPRKRHPDVSAPLVPPLCLQCERQHESMECPPK